jgi:outer membrane protein TolC
MTRRHRRPWRLAILLAVSVASCALGPNFKRPKAPPASNYGNAPSDAATVAVEGKGGDVQRFVTGMDIPADWWTLFKSPKLDQLIVQALKNNPNVGAAQAALEQAHQLYLAQWTTLLPNVQGGFTGDRSKFPLGTLTSPTVASSNVYTLYTAQLTLTYSPDIFGATRRAIEAAKAQEQNNRFQLEATYLTLTSNVAVNAVQEASLRGQIAATPRAAASTHRQGPLSARARDGERPRCSFAGVCRGTDGANLGAARKTAWDDARRSDGAPRKAAVG